MSSPLLDFLQTVGQEPIGLALDVAVRASRFGPERWGMTYVDGRAIRVNVGWTEIVTVSADSVRLIVDGQLSRAAGRRVVRQRGDDPRGFYPSVPGSVLVNVPIGASAELAGIIRLLWPAIEKSIALAARRRVGRGVRAGHNQWAVRRLALEIGRRAPTPGYVSLRGAPGATVMGQVSRMEGALRRVMSSTYERRPALRRACVAYYGPRCVVCGFSFVAAFGSIGEGFIHVHHLEPLADGGRRKVDAIKHLRPVCPNCHAMIHRDDPPIAIDELRSLLRKRSDR